MKFTEPAGPTPLDQERVLTRPHPRKEGPLKVTGQATYAYEYRDAALRDAAYGFVLGSDIAHGSLLDIDTAEAEAAPGVQLVLTHKNMPAQGENPGVAPQQDDATPQLAGTAIHHHDQAIALVVADTFEQARAAARLIRVRYRRLDGAYDLAAQLGQAEPTSDSEDSVVGDFDRAFGSAPVRVDVTYTTPDQSQAPMEPHSSLAHWEGDRLTLYTSHQILHWVHRGLAKTLQVPQKDIRIVSAYVGGGFGSKLLFYADAVLAAAAARQLGRPVKVMLTRHQIFNHTSHRPATVQRLRLGAEKSGRLVAVGHDSFSGNLPGGDAETAADQTKLLYAGEHRLIRTRLAELGLPPGASMRAPGEGAGMLALECAVDELAEALDMDPVELRILNDVQYDPEKGPGRPYSSRRLVEALTVGAERFGWKERRRPGERREGDWLVGLGIASAFRGNLVQKSGARVRLEQDGTLTVETQMTDIGTGSYTILGQVAAEMLGLTLEQVTVRLGDTDFPRAAGSGGSFGANSSSSGVYYACRDLRTAIAKELGFDPNTAVFEEGYVRDGQGGKRAALRGLAGKGGLSATGEASFGDLTERYVQASFGAHFAEVAVDVVTGETRVRRLLSVAAAGRILNPVTARSQCLGGMTMGIGAALMEELKVDTGRGLFVNHDLAEYHVPVHADIPDLDVIFLDELDDKSSPVKAKGLGELGICGVGAAVANAVYNATGVRVRDYPLTMEKILSGWSRQERG